MAPKKKKSSRRSFNKPNSMPGEATRRKIVAAILSVTHPRKIMLFGSRARGDAGPSSDMDLLVIAPSRRPRWRRTPQLYMALADLGASKDIVWWTPAEIRAWSLVKSHFITTAIREGKVLYEESG